MQESRGPLSSDFPGRVRLTSKQILGFLAFSHGWTFGFYLIAMLWQQDVWEMPAVIFFILGGAGVFLGGIIMTWVVYGREGLSELGVRIIDPTLVPGRWWAVVLFLPLLLTLLSAGVAILLGSETSPLQIETGLEQFSHPLQLLVTLGFYLLIGPLPEEIGWRGYLLDRLEVRWSAIAASLFIGVVWWIWHLPLFLLPGYFDRFGSPPFGPLGYLWVVPSAIIATWLYNNTNRSVLALIIFHLTGNLVGQVLEPSDQVRQYERILSLLLVVLLLLWWGPRTLQRDAQVERDRRG